jgi:hypothetical protein
MMIALDPERYDAVKPIRVPNRICPFCSQESMIEMRQTSAQVIREALCHKRLINVVNGVQMPVGA